jgi:ADP-heptose:LPS heptosyltransferase
MLRDLYCNYSPYLLGGLYFRFGINLIPESKYPVDLGGVRRVCVLADSDADGLDHITPMLRSLRVRIPDVHVTVVLPAGTDAMEDSDLVDEVVTLQGKRVFRKIRDDWPDLTIATGNGIMSAKMAFRTGARYRLGFKYDHVGKRNTGFLFTHTVPLDKSKSESEQLLNLIRTLL